MRRTRKYAEIFSKKRGTSTATSKHRQDQNPTVGAKLKLCFWKFSKKRSLKERNRERRKTIKPKTKQKNSQATKTERNNHSEQNKTINFMSLLRLIVTENGSKTKANLDNIVEY